MTKLVIFDLDGTLLDTIEDLANSVNYALKKNNYPSHPVQAYRFFIGNGVNNLLLRSLPEGSKTTEIAARLKVDFMAHYAVHAEACTRPYPGITELIAKIQRDGLQIGVASNKMHAATLQLAERFFPEIRFTAVLGQREGFPIKPDPAILEEIITAAGVAKNEVLYVGDSGVDAKTALNANVPFVGVLWGFRPKEELAEAGATRFAETAEELYELISYK